MTRFRLSDVPFEIAPLRGGLLDDRVGGYASFDDFLGALSSGRRKTIRRERREACSPPFRRSFSASPACTPTCFRGR